MDKLQRKISSLSAQWNVLRKTQVLLSLHKAFSDEARLGEEVKRRKKKRQPISMKDVTETCEFLVYYGQGDRSMIDGLSELLAAWKILVDGYRIVDRIVSGNSAIGPQYRKRIKSELRQLRETLNQQRCEQNHPAVLEVLARIPLDIRSNQWTKVLSLIPNGLVHLNNLMKMLHTDGTTTRGNREESDPSPHNLHPDPRQKGVPVHANAKYPEHDSRPSVQKSSTGVVYHRDHGQPYSNELTPYPNRKLPNRFGEPNATVDVASSQPKQMTNGGHPMPKATTSVAAMGKRRDNELPTRARPGSHAWVFQGDFDPAVAVQQQGARGIQGGVAGTVTPLTPREESGYTRSDPRKMKKTSDNTNNSGASQSLVRDPSPVQSFAWNGGTQPSQNPVGVNRRSLHAAAPSPAPTPPLSSSASMTNIDVSSPTGGTDSQAQRLQAVENRLVVFDYEMEAMKKTMRILERDLAGVCVEVGEYKKMLVKLETQTKLTDYRIQKTMRELENLGCMMLLQPLSQGQIRDIASWLRDDLHLRLAEILDIDLVDIENDYPIATYGIREVKVQILQRWKDTEQENATLETLVKRMMEDQTLLDAAKGIFDKISEKVAVIDSERGNVNAALGLDNL